MGRLNPLFSTTALGKKAHERSVANREAKRQAANLLRKKPELVRTLPVRLNEAESAALTAIREALGLANDSELVRVALRQLAVTAGVPYPMTTVRARTRGVRTWCVRCKTRLAGAEVAARVTSCGICTRARCASRDCRQLLDRKDLEALPATQELAAAVCRWCAANPTRARTSIVKCAVCEWQLTLGEDFEGLEVCRRCTRAGREPSEDAS